MDDWLLWQLVDSAFPSGSFPHSAGLEAAWQNGIVQNGADLRAFIDAQLRSAVYAFAPFVMEAYRNPAAWAQADAACDLFLNNHVANRASRNQGGAFLAAVEKVFGVDTINQMRTSARANRSPAHFAAVFGACLAILGLSESRACELLLFFTVRGAISSAVRLGIVGPMEGQSIQHAAGAEIGRCAERAMHVTIDEAAQTSPVLDLLQGTQDRLYSRLFQS
jgi:urease accessory protein